MDRSDGVGLSALWPLLLLVGLIGLAAVVAALLRGHTDVVVAKRAIPPFTKLTAGELESRSAGAEGLDASTTHIEDLVGSYTSAPVAAGGRVERSDVLVLADGRAGRFRFQVKPDRVDALGLEPGEQVRLWFSPTDPGGEAAKICAVLLGIPDSDSATEQTYVVAVGAGQAQILVDRLGRSRLLLTRPR